MDFDEIIGYVIGWIGAERLWDSAEKKRKAAKRRKVEELRRQQKAWAERTQRTTGGRRG